LTSQRKASNFLGRMHISTLMLSQWLLACLSLLLVINLLVLCYSHMMNMLLLFILFKGNICCGNVNNYKNDGSKVNGKYAKKYSELTPLKWLTSLTIYLTD